MSMEEVVVGGVRVAGRGAVAWASGALCYGVVWNHSGRGGVAAGGWGTA